MLRFMSLTAVAAMLLAAAGAFAAPVARGQYVRDYARLIFEWPEPARFSYRAEGNRLILDFDRPAKGDFGEAQRMLSPFLRKIETAGGGRSVILTMDKPYRARTFISGNLTGVDLLDIDLSRRGEPAAAYPASAAAAPLPAREEARSLPPEPVYRPVRAIPALNPLRAPEPQDAEPAAGPGSVPVPVQETVQETAREEQQQQEEVPPVSVPETPPQTDAAPPAVTAQRNEWGVELLFPWRERVASAIFQRGSSLWVVFSAESAFDLSQLSQPPASTYIKEARQLPVSGHTVLHIATQGMADAAAGKAAETEDWTITLTGEILTPKAPIPVQHNTDPPLKPHFFLPVLQAADALQLQDPLAGDRLTVIPLYNPGEGISRARRTVEFNLLKTAQGIAIEPLADGLRTAMLRNGLKIGMSEGLQLSVAIPPVPADKPDVSVTGQKTFFPYAEWKAATAREFFDRRHALLSAAATGGNQEKMKARLDLAKLYLGEGQAPEALGMLDTIKSDDLSFYLGARAAALRGAANFLMLRLNEAAQDFSSAELDGLKEAELWRDVMDAALGRKEGGFDHAGYDKHYISLYPPRLRQELGLIAADRYIAARQFNKAIKIFEDLNQAGILQPVAGDVDYMVAQISEQSGQMAGAVKLWEKLADAGNPDRLVRAKSEFALVNLLLRENEIPLDDAVRRLDRLRAVWRGDALEMTLLEQLGGLYRRQENYIDSLRAYRELLAYFPRFPRQVEVAQAMEQMFVQLFNEGGADKLPPLESLSLYYEFRELTPLAEEGDRMIRNLADRLASVDLLDRAAALLQHQVRFRLAGEERSRVGARLAVLHLLNREPEKALDALKVTGYGANPADLERERRLLAARALADMKQHGRAWQVIENDFSPEALALKQEICWETKDWANLVGLAEERLSNREDPSKKLSGEEAETLVRLAVAYMFQREYGQLKYLKDYFTPLLPDDAPQRETFAYITGDSGPVDHENIAGVAQDIANIQSFMARYRERIGERGLSSVAGKTGG